MKVNYKIRRRLSLVILLLGIPAYAVIVVTLMNFLESLPLLIELFLYVFFGVVWVFPLKFIFRGIRQKR